MRLFKFVTVGASGALIGMAVLVILTDIAGLYYLASFVIASICSITNNYLWNSKWTFAGKQSNIAGYGRYFLLSFITLGINTGLMYVFTDLLGLWYFMSAVLITGMVFVLNYMGSKKYVWNKSTVKVKP